jgi:hypothetical protein
VALLLFAPLPILFALLAAQDFRILGVPLAWWVLGAAVYPARRAATLSASGPTGPLSDLQGRPGHEGRSRSTVSKPMD